MTVEQQRQKPAKAIVGMELLNPVFEQVVQKLILSVDKANLAELRRDFHTRLRITLSQPSDSILIEDLWDFFYDWCLFEQRLPETSSLTPEDLSIWSQINNSSVRGLYTITKSVDEFLKLKEMYSGKVFIISKKNPSNFLGFSKGDIIEGRIVNESEESENPSFSFIRKPSYHPTEVHDYIKKKVRQLKKSQDYSTYQNWLWLLVGMYLKHRIYAHMPVERIYDDNSRI